MQPIDHDKLSSVRGGFGALLGALAQSAGPILSGVANIIGASKAGKAGGAEAAPPGSAAPPAAAAAAPGMPMQTALPPSDPGSGVSISVSINGVRQA